MSGTALLDTIIASAGFGPHIVCDRTLPAQPARFVPLPTGLHPSLAGALKTRDITEIYTHQAETFQHAAAGRSVVVVTPTASGKTLCYNLPVLHTLLEQPNARALYLFPTKALSQDQQSELTELLTAGAGVPLKTAVYDGDTPDTLRAAARANGRIIISNPDMLHAGILPNHPRWLSFFSNLKFIVIDEAHAYRGVFGSHVANVLRRLKRIARFYGASPRFILSSATIGNPRELAEQLTGEPVELVDNNGAPRGEKRIILYNPPLLDALQGIRASSITESRRWMLALLKSGVKTILFAHSRIKTEVAASYVNEDIKNFNTENGRLRVEAYRGGLLPNERREIERGLRDGSIQGVVSTNALELGIDIGGLDASIVAGFPGSFNSFWQQSGRAGRRGGTSVAVFVASLSPLDQFLMNDPAWFFGKPPEEARLDADNPYIFADHVKCAAFELPFKEAALSGGTADGMDGDPDGDPHGDPFGETARDALDFLEEDGVVRRTGGAWHWSDRSYPAEGVSLRSASADNVVIVDITGGRNAVIGEMDRPSAKEMLFKNAVYIHRGEQFLVEELDIANRKALVRAANVNYFTDGLVKTDIKTLSEDDRRPRPAYAAALCDVLVRTQTSRFKKLRFHTHENIGFGEIDLPEEEMQTRALVLLFPAETAGGRALSAWDETGKAAALRGLGAMARQIAGVFLLCDRADLGLAVYVRDSHFDAAAVYLYDKYPGGTGLAEALIDRTEELFSSIYTAITHCPCGGGCPSCVGPEHGKQKTVELLRALISA